MKNRKTPILIIYVVILLLLFSWMLGIFGDSGKGITYSQVVALFHQEQVSSFTVEGDTIYLQLHGSDNVLTGTIADADSFRREMWDTIQSQTEAGILESYDFIAEERLSPYDFVVPIILAGIVIVFVWMLIMSRANAKNPMADFGKARTVNGSNQKVTFCLEPLMVRALPKSAMGFLELARPTSSTHSTSSTTPARMMGRMKS